MVSMPVLNPLTGINRDFDTFELMPSHNDMAAMLDQMHFDDDRPTFYLLNVGETHYPYALPRRGPEGLAADLGRARRLQAHGRPRTAERAGAVLRPGAAATRCASARSTRSSYLDGVFPRLFDKLPPDTWLIVTADHGELFGEDGFFGHGPIMHQKVPEVPFVEGLAPSPSARPRGRG